MSNVTVRDARNLWAIARLAHEMNRAYCRAIGDDSQKPWGETRADIRNSALDGVEAILDGRVAEPGDSHRNWLAFKEADGWTYGPVKDLDAKTHPCLVPFEQLPLEQQVKDHLFLAAVRYAALLWHHAQGGVATP